MRRYPFAVLCFIKQQNDGTFSTLHPGYLCTNHHTHGTIIIQSRQLFETINYCRCAVAGIAGGDRPVGLLPCYHRVPAEVCPVMPPMVLVTVLLLTKKGRLLMDSFDAKTLTLLHIVRVPVELTLYWLYLNKAVPGIMTFEGRNFDILCGITAPLVYYWGYVKNTLSKGVLLAWNIACLLLLANIVITAVLSAPFSFQKFAPDQPNIALFYFPFIWLPCFIVPAALFAHVVNIRKLIS